MYEWLVFLHIGSVLALLTAHGIHATIAWRWRQAADPELGLTLFNGLPQIHATRLLVLAVIVTGIVLGFMGNWWGQAWIWISLAVLAAMWAVMYRWGGGYFGLVSEAATLAVDERNSGSGSTTAMTAYQATRLGWQPVALMAVGVGGLAVILWLMIFKPI